MVAPPSPELVRDIVARALAEDVGRGDITTSGVVPAGMDVKARIEARAACVVAGLDFARLCFEQVASPKKISWEARYDEGARAEAGSVLATIDGPARAILTAERTALNLLARACAIASQAAAYAQAVQASPVRIVDTRKTSPLLRVLDKYAVRVGGCHNHRSGLDDGILIKDNHVAIAGGVTEAVGRMLGARPHGMTVEVEVSTLDELDEALAAGADAVLLDNMTVEQVAAAVARAGGKVVLEASGGIDVDNVAAYAGTGVDIISIGALTHSVPNVDLALEMEPVT